MKLLVDNGIIGDEDAKSQLMNKYLEKHKYKIWQGKNGSWYTYLPDEEGALHQVRNKDVKKLRKKIVDYYRDMENHPKFREVYRQWIKEKEECGEILRNSVTRYNNSFKRFFPEDEPFCDIRLCDMTEGDLDKFLKRSIKKFGLTKKTYSSLTLILQGVFKFAKREKYTDFSISTFMKDYEPPKRIFAVKYKDPEKEVFKISEVKLLLRYFEANPTIYNLGLALAFYSGLRIGELSTLKREDNIKDCFLEIKRTEYVYQDEDGKYVYTVKEMPKADSHRIIGIPQKAQDIINQIVAINPNGEFLMMNECGRIREKRFNYHLKKACREVGIPERTSHKIRKTYGSNLLEKNVGEAVVKRQLGHKQISTTHNFYHYDITDDDKRMEMIEDAVCY